MDTFEIHLWIFAARKLLLFGGCTAVAILLPILALRNINRKLREREKVQIKLFDELDRMNKQ